MRACAERPVLREMVEDRSDQTVGELSEEECDFYTGPLSSPEQVLHRYQGDEDEDDLPY